MKMRFAALFLFFIPFSGIIAQTSADSLLERLQTPDPEEKVEIYLALAKTNWRYSTDSIYKYSIKALELANQIGYSSGKAKALVYIGVTHFYRSDYDSVFYYYKAASGIFKANNELSEAAITINNTGVLYKRTGDYKKALECYREALSIQESLGDIKEVGGAYLNIGNVYYVQFELDKALEYYFRALEKFELIDDRVKIASAFTNIGEIYSELGQKNEGLEYYRKALQLQNEENDKYGIANSYFNIGIIEMELGNYQAGEMHMKNSVDIYNIMQDKDAVSYVLTYLGELYGRTNQFDRAEATLNEAIALRELLGNEEGLSYSRYDLASLYFRRSRWDDARANLDISIYLSKKLNILNVIQDSYHLLSLIDSAQNKNAESLANYKLYISYKDSIFNEENSTRIAELQTKYETAKKEKEIYLLQQENELRKIKVHQTRIIYIFSLLALIILFQMIFLLYRNQRRKKEARLLLQKTMETEDKERKHFAEELHDGIGPLLSTVKLYINELNNDDIDQASRKLLADSNQILDEAVFTARNISHNLMPQNIEEDGLVRSLQIFTNRVCMKGSPPVHFDIAKLSLYGKWQQVLIYRIITELINNSIKHAAADSIRLNMLETNKTLIIVYKDNGKGFNLEETIEKSSGIGLKNIISRVKSINGKIQFESGIGKGFKVLIEFDLRNLNDTKTNIS